MSLFLQQTLAAIINQAVIVRLGVLNLELIVQYVGRNFVNHASKIALFLSDDLVSTVGLCAI